MCLWFYFIFFFKLNTDHTMSDHSLIVSVNSTVHSEVVVVSWWKVQRGHKDDEEEAVKRKPTVKMQLFNAPTSFRDLFPTAGKQLWVCLKGKVHRNPIHCSMLTVRCSSSNGHWRMNLCKSALRKFIFLCVFSTNSALLYTKYGVSKLLDAN